MFLLIPLGMALGSVSAAAWTAPAPELRLIETAPQKRAWMTEQQILQLSAEMHAAGRCGGFIDVTDHATEPDLTELKGIGIPENRDSIGQRPLAQASRLEPLFKEVSPENLYDSIRSLSAFSDRHYKSQSGVAASGWIRDRFLQYAHGRTDISVEFFKHSFAQPSVIGRIVGNGPLANEHVVLGGHLDSTVLGIGTGRKAPGADDNASGIATILEAFRILSESGYRPDRTIDFIGYAAEEAGLRGSQDVVQDYVQRGINVMGVMQLDMTSFTGKTPVLGLVSDHVNEALNTFQKRLLDTYIHYPWQEIRCGYGCSDHASWTRAGYRSVFPFETLYEEYNPNVHTERDTVEKLDMIFGSHFVKLALAFAMELGSEPH